MPKEVYTKSQKSIEAYLNELDFSRVDPVKSGQLTMRGKIVTEGKEFDTVVALYDDIPASHPKFYSVDCDMVFFEPHIERPEYVKNFGTLTGMCIKPEDEMVYYQNPVELIHNSFNDYERLCSDLTLGVFDSKADLFDEFDSYWPNNYTVYKYMKEALVDKKMVSLIILDPVVQNNSIQSQQLILTDSVSDIENYAKAAGYKISKVICPYIDLGKTFGLPLPYTYGDILNKITKTGHLKYLKKLQGQSVSNFLFLGFDLPDGIKHYVAVYVEDIIDSGHDKKKSRFQLFFKAKAKKKPFSGAHVKSISREWLMERGGDSNVSALSNQSLKIAIIGCGSIGSNLAYKLCKSGLSNMILIDPDTLKSDNIGRHFLGMQDVGKKKSLAMAETLNSQFIGMKVEAYTGKAQHFINEVSNVDLIITAIGSDAPAVEPHFAELVKQKELPPMLSCWLEADAIAGHSFFVDKEMSASFEEMTNKMELLDSDFASRLVKSENGCNSNYMPYSHLSADEHINKMAHFIIDIIMGKRSSRGLSSFGKVERFLEHLQYPVKEDSVMYWQEESYDV